MVFAHRQQAGELLAAQLHPWAKPPPLVLALPRGGVPVALPIARALHAPLQVIISRKVGAPFQPELALGALCENDTPRWNKELLQHLDINTNDLTQTLMEEKSKIQNYIKLFRHGKPLSLKGHDTLILVDDGLATGATVISAIEYLKSKGDGKIKIIVATPVAAADTITKIKPMVDDIVCLQIPSDFTCVGEWYKDFPQVSSEEVVQMLQAFHSSNVSSQTQQLL